MSLDDERGSAVAEFAMVTALLVALVIAVIQFALAMHVRATLSDAAAEGARYASLVGSDAAAGIQRTKDLITTSLGATYAQNVVAGSAEVQGLPTIEITVAAPLPLIGLIGPTALEVSGNAPIEQL